MSNKTVEARCKRAVEPFKIGSVMFLSEHYHSWRVHKGLGYNEDLSDLMKYEPFLIVAHDPHTSHVKILTPKTCGWIYVNSAQSILSFQELTPENIELLIAKRNYDMVRSLR